MNANKRASETTDLEVLACALLQLELGVALKPLEPGAHLQRERGEG